MAVFLGIPYAAPPVGNLRWQPPQRHARWTQALKATGYGAPCAQITELGVFAGPPNQNEDCLYLNIFSPQVSVHAKLPVIVWIHGGGDFCGESNDYDASKLASHGAVVVTFNYRLGLFGWLAHPALDAEGHLFGNYGLLDQQFVLRWVQENIDRFGGDRRRVTLAGQSAGSVNTEDHVVSPLARGLFHRAIFQSIVEEPTSLPDAEAAGIAFAAAAGCGSRPDAAGATCLRALTAAQIIALSGTASAPALYLVGPIADGQILPGGFEQRFEGGQFNRMPIMSGTTSDENNFRLAVQEYFSGPPRVPRTESDFQTYILHTLTADFPRYRGTIEKVLARYPLQAYATPQLALDAVRTDALACTQRRVNRLLAGQTPVYAYEFKDQTAPFFFPELPGFRPLAYHTSDLQYLFPLWHGGPLGTAHGLNSRQEQLSDRIVTAWTNFARTGNPNGEGNSPWPRYEVGSGKSAIYLSQNIPASSTLTDEDFSGAHNCNFWDANMVH
jgi:para-nitrobenzyl esterase